MIGSFESPKSLVRHAQEDLAELIAISKRVLGGSTHTEVFDREPETGHKRQKIVFSAEIPSRARYVANNILNNLRHALDQTLVASVEILTGTRSGEIYFPITTCPADLTGRLFNGKGYGAVPFALYTVLHSFEPYPRGTGYEGGNDFLCAITKVVGPNKHQITLSPGLDMGPGMRIRTMRATGEVYRQSLPPIWDMTKGEVILATMADDCVIEHDIELSFHISFGDTGPMFRHPVIPALNEFAAQANAIIAILEEETARILRSGGI